MAQVRNPLLKPLTDYSLAALASDVIVYISCFWSVIIIYAQLFKLQNMPAFFNFYRNNIIFFRKETIFQTLSYPLCFCKPPFLRFESASSKMFSKSSIFSIFARLYSKHNFIILADILLFIENIFWDFLWKYTDNFQEYLSDSALKSSKLYSKHSHIFYLFDVRGFTHWLSKIVD